MDEGRFFRITIEMGGKIPREKRRHRPHNLGHMGMSHCWWLSDKTVGQDKRSR